MGLPHAGEVAALTRVLFLHCRQRLVIRVGQPGAAVGLEDLLAATTVPRVLVGDVDQFLVVRAPFLVVTILVREGDRSAVLLPQDG